MQPYSTAESWTGMPGEIVPADGNYVPSPVALASLPAGFVGTDAAQNRRQDAGATDRDDFDDLLNQQANTGAAATPLDLGPNNERLEDVNPKVVHALRELVRQYREEGVVARRNENSPHPPGTPVLAGLAIRLVESERHELASAV